MQYTLSVSSTLEHDGDGVVRFCIDAESEGFAGSTLAWGNPMEPAELASLLSGFPKSIVDCVKYQFGAAGSGTCEMEFYCIDGSGHVGLWAKIGAAYNSRGSERVQSATLFLRVEPDAIDRFCRALRGFRVGFENEAVLSCVKDY